MMPEGFRWQTCLAISTPAAELQGQFLRVILAYAGSVFLASSDCYVDSANFPDGQTYQPPFPT